MKQALELALEALEDIKDDCSGCEFEWSNDYPLQAKAHAAIKEALAQPEQEPVGQLLEDAFGRGQVMWFNKPKDESMLYTTPPQRTWVGLTDEEKLVANQMWRVMDADGFIKAIEAKLKDKNL